MLVCVILDIRNIIQQHLAASIHHIILFVHIIKHKFIVLCNQAISALCLRCLVFPERLQGIGNCKRAVLQYRRVIIQDNCGSYSIPRINISKLKSSVTGGVNRCIIRHIRDRTLAEGLYGRIRRSCQISCSLSLGIPDPDLRRGFGCLSRICTDILYR